jgi:hypothetical protein
MERLIKIYGERNTGTNYLSQIIRLNLKAKQLPGVVDTRRVDLTRRTWDREAQIDAYFESDYEKTLGWKHTCPKPADELNTYPLVAEDLIVFLTVTKNPYSWLLSLHRNPYHQHYVQKPDFETFLSLPWRTVGRDNTRENVANPIELWNLKNASYLRLPHHLTLNLTSEQIIIDPRSIIETIHQNFSIDKRRVQFSNYSHSTKSDKKDHNYYRDYYQNEKWKEQLSDRAIETINAHLDRELLDIFGYKLVD